MFVHECKYNWPSLLPAQCSWRTGERTTAVQNEQYGQDEHKNRETPPDNTSNYYWTDSLAYLADILWSKKLEHPCMQLQGVYYRGSRLEHGGKTVKNNIVLIKVVFKSTVHYKLYYWPSLN